MMNYFQEISLLPKTDIALCCFWQKVYQQMHLALVENKKSDNTSAVGVAFPEYDTNNHSLGTKLRLFSQEKTQLQALDVNKWLANLNDYVHITQIREVFNSVNKYVCFKRVQFQSNPERLARRRAKRKSESIEEALKHYQNINVQLTTLPYVNMRSLSKGEHFKLFIDKQSVDEPKSGNFSCYGLSVDGTTIPEF